MFVFAIVFLVSGILLWRAKRPEVLPNSSFYYKIDNRVIGSVLLIMAACFFVLGLTAIRNGA
jgi:cytochrome b subunit of formate dehydrogenase